MLINRSEFEHTTRRMLAPVFALARIRFVVLGLGVLLASWLNRAVCPVDLTQFAGYGKQIVTGHWAAVYPDSWNQGGPIELLGALVFQPNGYSVEPLLALHIVGNTFAVALVLVGGRVARRAHNRPVSPVAELAAGTAMLIWIEPMLWIGHLSELLIPALWLLAAERAWHGKAPTAAVLIGLSAGVETWGILALPLLLADGGVRRVARSGALAVAVAVAAYLPFVLSGRFEMFHHAWPISDYSWVHWLWPQAQDFTWSMRLAQGALTMFGSAAVVLLLRRHPDGIWIAPLSVLLLRLLGDPTLFGYYWTAVLLVVLVGLGTASGATPAPVTVTVLLLAYLPFLRGAWSFRGIVLVETVFVLVLAAWLGRRQPARAPVALLPVGV